MSKDKIHIDDLFKKLSDHHPELENNAWAEMSDRMHDGAWQKKFADFEPQVEEDDFPLIVHSVSDEASSPVKPSRLWSVLLLLFLFVASMTWVAISYVQMINKSKAKEMQVSASVNENQNKRGNDVAAKDVFEQNNLEELEVKEGERLASVKPETPAKESSDGLDKKPAVNNMGKSNSPLKGKSTFPKNAKLMVKTDEQKELVANNPSNEPTKDLADVGDKTPAHIEEKQNEVENPITENKAEKIVEEIEMIIEISDEETEDETESNIVSPVDTIQSTSNDTTKKAKSKWGLSASIGMGALVANPPLADANRNVAERFFVNFEASKNKMSFRTGIDFQHFSYTNKEIIYRKVDSIPHLNPGGDTIGWFQTNPRDTTKSGRYNSDFRVVSVPVGFNYTILNKRKMELTLGAGGNFNFIRSRGFYVLDENRRHVLENSSGNSIRRFEAGYYMDLQVRYALNNKTRLFVGSGFNQIRNISRSQNFDLQLSGYSFTFGLNYLLK